MKKFTSILLMLFFALSGLFAANMKGGEVFYLTPHTTWNSDNARYAIYFFNNSTGKNTWASMSKVEGESNLWTGTVPAGDWANLIFCRMNPSATTNGWGSGVYWGGQTQDLTWDGTNNWFKVDSSKDAWNKPAGTWSTYTPPTPDPEPEPEPEDPDTPVDPEDPDQPVDPEDPDTPVEPATTITISFASDWETANFYAWNDAATLTAAWPGDAMTAADGKFTYELTLPEGAYSFIINNGNGTQTVDTEGVAESTCFVIDENKAGKWTLAVSADCEATDPKPIETSYVLMGVGGDWNTGIAMTPNPGNADEYVVMGQAISAATDAVKVVVFSAEGTIYCGTVKEGSVAYTQDDMQNIVLADGTYDFYYSISENAIYIGESLTPDPDQPVDPEDPDTPVDPEDPDQPVDPEDPDTPVDPEDPDQPVDPEDPDQPVDPEDPDTPVDPATTITISFASDWEAANFYAWTAEGELTATWPGDAMTAADGKFTYELTLPEGDYSFIINNGNGTQTVNNEGVAESTCFVLDENKAGKWTLAVSANCEATDPKPIETSYVLMGVGGDWNTGIAMTPNPDNADEYVVMGQAISAATDAVKVVVFSAEGTIYCGTVKEGSVAYTQDGMQNIVLADGTYDFYYSISENAIYIGESLSPDPDQPVDPEDPDTPVDPEDPDQPVDPEDPDTPVDPEDPDQPVDPATTITISFASDWEAANFYAWTAEGELTATWPGDAMTAADGKFTYELTLPEGDYSFIINNGNGTQTVNNEGVAESTCFVLDENKAGKWTLAVSANCEATDPKPIETSYVLMGVGGDWETGIAMTPNPDNADEYVVMGQAISAATDAVKVVVFSSEGTIYCGTVKEGSVAYTQDGMQNIVLADGTYDFYYSISENAIYIGESLTPDPDQPVDPEDPDQPVDPEDPDTPVDPEPVMITLYYVNNQGWEEVAAYAWDATPIAEWPGELATKTDLTAKGYDVYSYTFDSSKAVNIIFNNNNNGSQTTDLTFDPSKPYFYIDQWYASLEDIEAISSIEELAAYNIYATNGTIYADCEFAIYNLGGIDVTAQNGSLEGNYVVKTQKGSLLISVW